MTKRITICIDVEDRHLDMCVTILKGVGTTLESIGDEHGDLVLNWDVAVDEVKDEVDESQEESDSLIAEQEGRRARREGKPSLVNPYNALTQTSQHLHWTDGYLHEEQILRTGKE